MERAVGREVWQLCGNWTYRHSTGLLLLSVRARKESFLIKGGEAKYTHTTKLLMLDMPITRKALMRLLLGLGPISFSHDDERIARQSSVVG